MDIRLLQQDPSAKYDVREKERTTNSSMYTILAPGTTNLPGAQLRAKRRGTAVITREIEQLVGRVRDAGEPDVARIAFGALSAVGSPGCKFGRHRRRNCRSQVKVCCRSGA